MRRTKQQTQYLLTPRSKWKMHHRYCKFQSQNVQIFGYVCQYTNGPNHGPVWKIQSFLLERNLHGHPLPGLLWERQFEKALLKIRLGKSSELGMLIHTQRKRIILVCVCRKKKLAGKKQNVIPTWKIPMKDIDLGERTSCLDHVYLGCTQRECQISKDIVDNYKSMFESRISAGAMEKLPT